MRVLLRGALLACALVGLASEARAQESWAGFVERQTKGGQDIRFEDDPLGALPLGTVGNVFGGYPPARRLELMRPRQTFVPEMLRAIEAI
jgi:hypothetical protein